MHHIITYLNKLKQQLRTKRTQLDHVVIAAATRQWHRQWVHISDVCFCTPSIAVFHTCSNQLNSNLANLNATVNVE